MRTGRSLPVKPALLALGVVASNWLLYSVSFGPGTISGNGFHPLQLLAGLASFGLGVALCIALFRWLSGVADPWSDRTRWVGAGVLFAVGVALVAWGWALFRQYEVILPYRGRGGDWGIFNQYTLRCWAVDAPYWLGLLTLVAVAAILRGLAPVIFLVCALALAFVLPGWFVPQGPRVSAQGELVILKPGLMTFRVTPKGDWPEIYIVRRYSGEYLALAAADPLSYCQLGWRQVDDTFIDPCKGSEYDFQGKLMKGPSTQGMGRYPIREQGGKLFIDLGKPPVSSPSAG